jgi:hypothetical protein
MSVYLRHGLEGATLSDVIGAADVMNHAVPTSGELTRALTRLAQSRVISQVNGRYLIASNYLPAIAVANEMKGGLFATPDKGKNWLSSSEFDMDEKATITVSKEDVAEAFEQYRTALKRK